MRFQIYFATIFLFHSINSFSQLAVGSQTLITQGKTYTNIRNGKDADAQGYPFLFDHWMIGKIVLKNGTQFKNVKLNFDAEKNKFLYTYNDSVYELTGDVYQVLIHDTLHLNDSKYDMIFRNNIKADKIKPGNFVQVLNDGKVTLLKELRKVIEGENATNGYTSTVKQYVLQMFLWAIIDNKTMQAKFSNKFLENITADKISMIKAYIIANKLNTKNEKDFSSALSYYNSITASK